MTESKIDVPIVERKSVLRDQSEITVSTKTVGNESYVLAKQGDQIVGSFAYERTEHGRCDYETDLVQAHVKNNGVGKALIQAFVDAVGPGKTVYSSIYHDPSLQFLKARFPNPNRFKKFKIGQIDPELIKEIPLVKFLSSSGIDITEVDLNYTVHQDRRPTVLHADFKGITK
jgi:hypothetical protein